ncbi:hypothetical protein [Allonocardiopsis opalescens]|uniref:Uncharacterized protein n=1 Tax=Allonocardiopsis opalescens TaxID=1144618 RepID=A0A2T0QAY0_9ACTN|nr:hypothetical protein [Allonocardiopsis opalescens]PRY00975.1 hypothetical protein CLV72_102608 [Allonocardiopsis opalescens]
MRNLSHDEYDTELLRDGEVLRIGSIVYRGRTVLPADGPDAFAPLRSWAQGAADFTDSPITWRACQGGKVVAEGSLLPAQAPEPG